MVKGESVTAEMPRAPHWVNRAADLRPRTVRDRVRHVALDVLSLGARLASERKSPAPHVQIVALHHVFPDEGSAFCRLLSRLQETYRFIGYDEAVDRILSGDIDDAYLTFSFDDGLKCCRTAAEIMGRFGARGCFFICPPVIGETDHNTICRFCHERLRLPPVEFMTWDDLDWLRSNGHDIGGHTMGHVDLATVSQMEAQDEISKSYDVLSRRLGSVEHFAWPYGRFHHIRPEVVPIVFDCGYRSCASVERGSHAGDGSTPSRQVCLKRDTIEVRWPLSHILYFLDQSARRPLKPKDSWPSEWLAMRSHE